jgi:hypothetical protein
MSFHWRRRKRATMRRIPIVNICRNASVTDDAGLRPHVKKPRMVPSNPEGKRERER